MCRPGPRGAPDGDDEGRPRRGGQYGRSAIDERRAPEKWNDDGPAHTPTRELRHLIDHHRDDPTAPHAPRPRFIAPAASARLHALRRSRRLPEGIGRAIPRAAVWSRGAAASPRYRAGSPIPIARVRSRDDDTPSPQERLLPPEPRRRVDSHARERAAPSHREP